MSLGGKSKFVSEINVTPFVDVMLVLLIIFMVATPMMSQGLDVDLPQTKQVEVLPTDADHMILTVRRDGLSSSEHSAWLAGSRFFSISSTLAIVKPESTISSTIRTC